MVYGTLLSNESKSRESPYSTEKTLWIYSSLAPLFFHPCIILKLEYNCVCSTATYPFHLLNAVYVYIHANENIVQQFCRYSVLQGQFRVSLENNKMLTEKINQLDKEIVSLRRMVEHKNQELEKYNAK